MTSFNPYHLWMIITFVIGYFLITIEHVTKINKTSVALLMGILCWIFQFASQIETHENNVSLLAEHLANISQIIFFLLGALTIVEIINVHRGFQLVSNAIRVRSKRKLLWLVGFITFFLSSILDNLTTTIIMVTLLRRLLDNTEERLLIGGAVVITANAGGAWTPIGDVTTTMLWIGGQLSTLSLIKVLFLPSIICLITALLCLSWFLKEDSFHQDSLESHRFEPRGVTVFWLGMGCLIFVPFFKMMTGLPPFMGIIFGLGVMWLFTDFVHQGHEDRGHLRVPAVISCIDVSSVLFFLGILLCIDALHAAGLLNALADWMNQRMTDTHLIAMIIGLASAVIDNVPLVAATMGMYELTQYPMDSSFWNMVAYCAGTGGSILVIGSAAGVAFMGLERVQFFWYLRRIGLAALISYFAGVGTLKLMTYYGMIHTL